MEEDVGAIDVRERVVVDEVACPDQHRERLFDPPQLEARRRPGEHCPQLEVRLEGHAGLTQTVEARDRLVELSRGDRRFRLRDHARRALVLG